MATSNQPQASLPSLPAHLQSDTHITAHLASRFHLSLPTAVISSHALISLNTYTGATVAAAECEKMAERMWRRLGERAESQAVVFLGESGSGKTTLRSHLLTSLLSFTSTPLSHKISLAAFIFDTLTTTKSLTTPTASKAGLFLELQYDNVSSTLIGGKLLDHRLERSRIAGVPTGERNFHILYYLLAGTSPAEKDHLGLNTLGTGHNPASRSSVQGKRWRYLGHPTQLKVGINDAEGFNHFKTALRKLEFSRTEIAEVCQILAAILHIGQLEFQSSMNTRATGEESGAMEGGEEVVVVKNKDTLTIVAAFLGVSVDALEQSMGYKTKVIHKERVTVMLDARGARLNADDLARTLYSLLVAWIIESVNERLCAVEDSVANTISMVDFPGFSPATNTSATSSLDMLLTNAANEALYSFCLQNFFERSAEKLESEEVNVAATSYFDNGDAVRALLKQSNGILAILDDQTKRGRSDAQFYESIKKRFEGKNPAVSFTASSTSVPTTFGASKFRGAFTVRHFAGEVEYPCAGLLEDNGEVISGDLMLLFRSTTSNFVSELFNSKAVTSQVHPKEKNAVVQAQISSKPLRQPSVMRKKGQRPKIKAKVEEDTSPPASEAGGPSGGKGDQGAAGQFLSSIDTITKAMNNPFSNTYFIFCLKPNDRRIEKQFDSKCVRTQVRTLGLAEISQRVKNADFSIFLPFGELLGLAEPESHIIGSEREKAAAYVEQKRWPANEASIGATGIFISESIWAEIAKFGDKAFAVPGRRDISDDGASPFGDSRVHLTGDMSPGGLGSHIYGDSKDAFLSSKEFDARSDAGASAFNSGDMFKNFETREQLAEKGAAAREEEIDVVKETGSRKRWMFVVYLLTFYIPDFMIRLVGRMKRKDVRIAWREKFAINLLIWLSCAFVIFFTFFFPRVICPTQHVYSPSEVGLHAYDETKPSKNGYYTSIRGEVFDIGKYAPHHYPSIVNQKYVLQYAGKDATKIFPVQINALCIGVNGKISDSVQFNYKLSNGSLGDRNMRFHDFRAPSIDGDFRPDWYFEQMKMLRSNYKKGEVGWSPQYLTTQANKMKRNVAMIHGNIYDLTDYINGQRTIEPRPGFQSSKQAESDRNFMDNSVVDLFRIGSGQDQSRFYDALKISDETRSRMNVCLRNLFYVGTLDKRNSTPCQFATYLPLAITALLASVIVFKFLAALQFGRKNLPEQLDKFIMCQVPAYTEDEESLRRAIDSLARMKYDDKRKLLVVICDGMIIGQGNDRPTPRIVLDILGWSGTEPETLSFESLGEGQKQHNMGKVYSGLYDTLGHIVPFIVVVKVGKPSEVSRPGNRGKRDSQMVIMRFLNRVHYNLPMSPMELEMHHQIRNVIGVNPTFYEFLYQIDADTSVAPDTATRMVASFLNDTRIIALCGETGLSNAKGSIVTMMQVYEYYISHNIAKAFESLFGSVTCLPGCFSMYRIRTAETGKPLFVSKEIVEAYAVVRVDTLHMKNLLHLGEDRYLTTLLLKHHPKYKTKYLMSAKAYTVAPDTWSVFLSQRRRWINSTVHNLVELIPMSQLCGFCCFSMRFVVFLDLLSTIVGPAVVAYLGFLIYSIAKTAADHDSLEQYKTAFLILGAIYGLQAMIFILRRKWEMIGWMIVYLFAIPIFSFALPLYSFWHMDDFSWGNTRVVTGEKGQKIVISDEGKFDPAEIPRKKWEEYQAEIWESQTMNDTRSEVSGYSYATKSHAPGSEYGGMAPSRPMSQLEPPFRQGGPRTSMAASEMMGQRGSTFMGPEGMELINMELPPDDAILAEIREILRTADLMTVTKKGIKQELEKRFGVPLDAKRVYINSATEALLSGQL